MAETTARLRLPRALLLGLAAGAGLLLAFVAAAGFAGLRSGFYGIPPRAVHHVPPE